MVTHDSKIASYSSKLLYIKDGVIDETIERKRYESKEYFTKSLILIRQNRKRCLTNGLNKISNKIFKTDF